MKGLKLPRKFIQLMKKKKRKKIRQIPIDKHVNEKKYNDAKIVI